MAEPQDQKVYYFGCWRQPGHYLWEPSEYGPYRSKLDGKNWVNKLDSRGWQPSNKEGEAKVTPLTGWTILSFADRSVDSRGGSHSTFVIRGTKDFDEALAIAKENFPQVFDRFKFEIKEVKNV